MLIALRILNLAVIDEAEVAFGPGMTVLTGETGAGKSILVDALGLLLGGRADADVIRGGAEEAVVEGTFAQTPALSSRLEAAGLPLLGSEVSVRRVVSRAGRGKVHVNGALVTVGVLAELMRGLVDIAGQHEHVSLFDPRRHRDLLDHWAQTAELKAAFATDYGRCAQVQARMDELGGDDRQVLERIEFLRFQLDELNRFDPKPGEDRALDDLRRRLAGSEKLKRTAEEAEVLLFSQEASASELVGRALAIAVEATKLDASLEPVLVSLRAAAAEVEDAARCLGRYAQGVEADPGRLAEVDDRVDALKRLCRKHNTDLEGLIARRTQLAEELGRLEHRTERLGELQAEREAAERVARKSAKALSRRRSEAAEEFGLTVRGALRQLAMEKAAFEVRVTCGDKLSASGLDEVEFFFSANLGEPVKPLLKVASGGEASRLLLALKRAVVMTDSRGSYVLDEVDAGVSGAVAEVVGRMIKEVSGHHQVLCITHLPQVAAFADSHLLVEKAVEKGRTFSRVVPLAAPDRTRELARMLSGVELTAEAVVAAEALIRSANRPQPAPAAARKGRTRPERQKILQSA